MPAQPCSEVQRTQIYQNSFLVWGQVLGVENGVVESGLEFRCWGKRAGP